MTSYCYHCCLLLWKNIIKWRRGESEYLMEVKWQRLYGKVVLLHADSLQRYFYSFKWSIIILSLSYRKNSSARPFFHPVANNSQVSLHWTLPVFHSSDDFNYKVKARSTLFRSVVESTLIRSVGAVTLDQRHLVVPRLQVQQRWSIEWICGGVGGGQ